MSKFPSAAMSSKNGPIFYFEFRYSLNFEDPDTDQMLSAGRAHVDTWLKQVGATEWIYQYENTESKKTTIMGDPEWYNPHLQGYLKLKDKNRLSTLINQLPPSLKGNGFRLERCSTIGLDAIKAYCMKEETRCGGPWGHKRFLRTGKDLELFQNRNNWFQWELQLDNICIQVADDRTIHWVWGPEGNQGKSKWAKWMFVQKRALVLNYSNAENLRWMVASRDPYECYILDATRATPKSLHKSEFYSALENIKNGLVMSGKYEGKVSVFDPPHVIVLANKDPDWEQWSKDRIKIWNLTDKILMHKGPYNPDAPYDDDEALRQELNNFVFEPSAGDEGAQVE